MRYALAGLVAIALAMASPAEAQPFWSPDEAGMQACLAATGGFYTPQDTSNVARNPVNGTTRVRLPLEGDACAVMITPGGWKTVAFQQNTNLRWLVAPDGSMTAYAHDDCANDIRRLVFRRRPAVHQIVTDTVRNGGATAVANATVNFYGSPAAPAALPQTALDTAAINTRLRAEAKRAERMTHGYCSRHRNQTGCVVGGILVTAVAGYFGYRAISGGDTPRREEEVTTLPICEVENCE